MRILFFAPYQLWPSNSGARIRSLELASVLAQNCSVTVVQILKAQEALAAPPAGSPFSQVLNTRRGSGYTAGKILGGLLGPVPLTVLNYQSEETSKVLAAVLSENTYDAVQMESIHLYSYAGLIRSAANPPAILLDWHNIESELMWRYASEATNLPKRMVARRTAGLLHRFEDKALADCEAHTVVSEREREKLLQRNPKASVCTVPNGVDTATFAERTEGLNPQTVLFVGSMDYHANIDAVRWFSSAVWPDLSARQPSLRFVIVGRSPSPEVQALAGEKVQVTGTVDDVRPFYQDALTLVVPLRVGGGTRLKILEAMAMGVPVVSTSLGAEGIDAVNDKDILIADNEQEMVAAVERLAVESNLRTRLVSAARRLVETRYDWGAIGSRLHEIHLELASGRLRQ